MKKEIYLTGFIHYLNRGYFICAHVAERLDELKSFPAFKEIHTTIEDTVGRLQAQINQFDGLFIRLGTVSSYDACEPVINFLEDVFGAIQSADHVAATITLLDYVSIADSLLKESARSAIYSASHLQNREEVLLYDATILQLLKVSLEDALSVA